MPNQAFVLLESGQIERSNGGDLTVPWWSFGKTILAATALRLVEQRRLSLDDKLGAYTLRQLLRHEAGLADYGGVAAYHQAVAAGDAPWSEDELMARADADRPLYPAGAGWTYSNIGYLRVRTLIEDAFGAGLEVAAKALVFEPLGAWDARLASRPEDLVDVEMGSARGYHPGWVYHGLFVGPLRTAATLLDGLMGAASPLSTASLAAMRETYALSQFATPPWTTPAYGLGLMCSATKDGWAVEGHTGGGPGTHVAIYRRTDGRSRTAATFAEIDEQAPVEITAVDLLA